MAQHIGPGRKVVTAHDVASIFGKIEDAKVAAIVEADPSYEDLEEAAAWLADEGEPQPLTGKAAIVYQILNRTSASRRSADGAIRGGRGMFADRMDAGEVLAGRLLHVKDKNPAVFALARGGVPVGFEIAVALAAPLDAVLVRKLGAPHREELAIGAIADAPSPELVLNQSIIDQLKIPENYIERIKVRELAEIARRKRDYFGDRPRVDPNGKTAIVVDDGIATGATMRAALRAVRRQQPRRLVLAVPVAAPQTLAELRDEADEIICLCQPEWLGAISVFYRDFNQVNDEEVIDLLSRATVPSAPKDHPKIWRKP